jgi:hypothetical protein
VAWGASADQPDRVHAQGNMTQVSIEHLPADTELTDVKSEQIRILFAAIPSSLFAVLVCSTILSIAQWQIIDHGTIAAWFALTNLLSLLRLLMYQQFKREQQSRSTSPLRRGFFHRVM